MKRIKYVPSKEVRLVVLLLKMAAVAVVVYYAVTAINVGRMMAGPTLPGESGVSASSLIPVIFTMISGVFFASFIWALALLVCFAASIAHHAEESVVFQQHMLEELEKKNPPEA